jgi:glycosyltransferase involved in cell wall biosynthesis
MSELEKVDVVIPALNESETIGNVVRAFRRGRNIGRILVVNDLSADRTASIAKQAGATIIKGPGQGKGQAMSYGLREVRTNRVIFADADTHGLTPEHVNALAFPTKSHIVGVRDMGKLNIMAVASRLPTIAGERSLPVSVLKGVQLTGYHAETQINAAVTRAGIPNYHFIMRGVTGTFRAGPLRWLDVAPAVIQKFPELMQYPRNTRWLKPV